MIDKRVTSFRFNEIKNGKNVLSRFLINFIVCRLAKTVLHQSRDFLGSDVNLGSQCGCHLRLFIESMNVYAHGRQKALTMLAYCVAANCNNSQAAQNITMHSSCRIDRLCANLCISDKLTLSLMLCHITSICVVSTSAECDFTNLIEYCISEQNLKPTAFPSVQKVPKQTAEHLKQNER